MKVKMLNESSDRIDLEVHGVPVSFINTLRRYSMMRVPTYAIDSVIVYENTTAMIDEFIAHRLGMIPIKTPNRVSPDETAVLTLDVQGPRKVYSRDLQPDKTGVEVANKDILLFTLENDQSLRVECTVRVGTGAKHAKFQSGLSSYEQLDDTSFKFFVESFGQRGVKDLLKLALKQMETDCKDLVKTVKKIYEK